MTKVMHIEDELITKLNEPIDKAHLSVRDGRGNTKYYYVKQAILADYLNQVFGPLGWDLKAGDPTIERRVEARTKKRNNQNVTVDFVVFEVVTKVTLRIKARTVDSSDTIFQLHGVGSGEAEVGQNTKDELGKAIKGAESDGLKRCAQELGKRFGLMLTTRGTQDAIDYAQANDQQRRQEMQRNEEQSSNSQGDRGAKKANSGNDAPRSQREEPKTDDRSRSNTREPERKPAREEDRNQADKRDTRNSQASDERPREDARENSKPKHDEPRDASKNDDRNEAKDNERSEQSDRGNGGSEKASKGNEKAEISDQYDLDILPMTTPEQASFAKTLVRVIGEAEKRDREDLVSKHHDTVRNLDGRIKSRFISVLHDDFGIEFNAVRV